MAIDLTEEERAQLAHLLRLEIAGDKFPLSPRVQALKRILAKLEDEGPRRRR